eukprot:gnl/MRDRNA2_/MRDRNA2_77843_c0_seq2.p1 gnl/MRDRNA2_/MRDRNA2_77843_c0~~gnl/MRDRNA2_/MRDRNA2_77843_c0_seq2.p1  ORF type:complete len:276 (-),score=51.57 gnl/MRDRNA2_/MRDRNA2_77843_c0_seq2:280-987(-)
MPLTAEPGPDMTKDMQQLSGAFFFPLGYGSLYDQPSMEAANVQGVVEICHQEGADSFVLVIQAIRDIVPGEVLVLDRNSIKHSLKTFLLENDNAPVILTNSGQVYASSSPIHGAGVFSINDQARDAVLEVSPALVLSDERSIKAATDYTMKFGACGETEPEAVVLALGLGALYNHKEPHQDVDYWYDASFGVVMFTTRKAISKGAEVFIDYGTGYWRHRGIDPEGGQEIEELVCD